ncbi:hypothetical protein LSM04_009184 [Trypanosoma melophagium]|uniref:uncharacterized protein n=1 Tax=Trypanosoma melophagium TaxID=715481 RepID=UPI00351A3EE5|nr:hypothetical protein LSM04_009184 [Trypanosoma melophagium]
MWGKSGSQELLTHTALKLAAVLTFRWRRVSLTLLVSWKRHPYRNRQCRSSRWVFCLLWHDRAPMLPKSLRQNSQRSDAGCGINCVPGASLLGSSGWRARMWALRPVLERATMPHLSRGNADPSVIGSSALGRFLSAGGHVTSCMHLRWRVDSFFWGRFGNTNGMQRDVFSLHALIGEVTYLPEMGVWAAVAQAVCPAEVLHGET